MRGLFDKIRTSMLLARAERGGGGGSVSLEPEDAISVGIFGPGPATCVESVFADYNYGGTTKSVPVWLITWERDGEKYEQPYSIGSGWRVSSDGESIIPKNGQTGLPDSCNAMLLLDSLREAGLAKGLLKDGNPRVLEGMDVVLKREAQPDRGMDSAKTDRKGGGGGKSAPKTILLVEEIVTMPGEGKKSKGKGKGKAEDEDEKPTRNSKSSRNREDDDDDDEKPTRGGKGKGKADEDEEPSEEDGIELMLEILEAAKRNTIEIDDVEVLVKKHLKGQDNAKDMAAFCATDDFLSVEKGWTVNAKKGTVSLD